MAVPTVTVQDLKAMRDAQKDHLLVDVREPQEYETCRIEGALLLPLGQLAARMSELPKDKELIVHCHHGGRSAQAVNYLVNQGYKASNLAGGIDAWSEEIDPKVPRY
jgi:adenylyltransferase/sulfurtransferase